MKNNIVVIFSSHLTDEENKKFILRISNSIGVKHKVICYPNFNQYSLTEIYNKGINEHYVKDCIFVMCHNDIIIKTRNWGRILLGKFNNNNNYDILGVAGTSYLPESGIWWEDRTKMLGIVEHTDGINEWVSNFSPEKDGISDAVLIDGLFMSFDPDSIECKFDENYKGFHFYDISFCIKNYLEGCNIGVTTSIRILHNSVGETNDEWEINRLQFIEEYKDELSVTILPHIEYDDIILTSEPKVTVIIPTKNNFKYISDNIKSWKNEVKYSNYKIIIADTGSDDEIINKYDELLCSNIRLVKYDYYNFSKINNDVVNNHIDDDTKLLLFCNDDIVLLNDALSRCVKIYLENEETVGSIGIRLHYSNGNVQHNGIYINYDNNEHLIISHLELDNDKGYSINEMNIVNGNTAAFLLINKELFKTAEYFNENYIECFEDVELNFKLMLLNKINITVSSAVGFHYESVSRNKDNTKIKRVNKDYLERLLPFYLLNKDDLDKCLIKYGA